MENNNQGRINDYDYIIKETNIVDIISHYVKVVKKGSSYFAICPFHNDTSPSLSIQPDKKIWTCWSCGAKGNVIDFVANFKKCSRFAAAQEICELSGIKFVIKNSSYESRYFDQKFKSYYDINKQLCELYKGFLYNKENEAFLSYLYQRGLSDEVIAKFNIGYAPNSQDLIFQILTNKNDFLGKNYDQGLVWNEQQLLDAGVINIFSSGKITTIFTNRIMFPILDINGYILGFSGRSIDKKADEQGTKYINSKENEIFKKNEIFYNINNIDIRECETLIIVEGFMDAIAYYRAGYHNVVATMGVAFSEAHIKVLKSFSKLKNIVLSFDNDATGEAANYRVGTILAKEKFDLFCCRITEPEIKDVDELLKKRGEVKVKEMFDNKQDFFVFYIDYMLNEIETLSEKNKKTTEVLEFISKYIDILSVDTYLEAISKKTNIKLENLKLKFSQLIGKPIHTIGQPTPVKKEYKASTPRQAASTKFNYNVNAEKTMSDKINATIETKKNSISRGIDELIASSFINIAAFIYLVNQLPSPTYINDLNKRNIIKIIKLVYERDKTIEHITIDDVNQLSKELKLEDSPHYDLWAEYLNSLQVVIKDLQKDKVFYNTRKCFLKVMQYFYDIEVLKIEELISHETDAEEIKKLKKSIIDIKTKQREQEKLLK